jgi:hypothetical protein
MGKYDGPHFGTDNNVVSVWLANTEYKKNTRRLLG